MAEVIFVTGGARSGKSRFAENLADRFAPPLLYVATAGVHDDGMADRVARHRQRRGDQWQTVEEEFDLAEVIAGHDGYFGCALVECVTLWITNLMLKYEDDAVVMAKVRELASILPSLAMPVIFVTNETGMGIVPDNALARRFRDLAGEANEILAAASDEAYALFSGLPLKLK